MRADLSTRIGSARLTNPIMTAAGTSGHGAELADYFDLSRLGAVVVKSLSLEPWPGNRPPRLYPLPAGMLNSVGLQNRGVHDWLERDLPQLREAGATIVASVWGHTVDEYRKVGAALVEAGAPAGIAAVELNISCPNLDDHQRMFAHSAEATAEAVRAALEGLEARLPVWAKLSPEVPSIADIAIAAISAGAQAVTLINTASAKALDPVTGDALLGAGAGGLSGPLLHPVAVKAVFDCRRALSLAGTAGLAASAPAGVIGVGGVFTGEDAAELLAAGADAVQVGTATLADPRAPLRILRGLERWCVRHGIATLEELKGRAQRAAGTKAR
jgi:dihydroorotate dehydrogenase (NAD+) catalytic subunit